MTRVALVLLFHLRSRRGLPCSIVYTLAAPILGNFPVPQP